MLRLSSLTTVAALARLALWIVRDITALAHIANAASSMCLRKRRLRPEQVKSSLIPLTPLLGLAAQYTGLRTTSADPTGLVKGRDRLRDALADVVHHYVEHDGAQAVIIAGGPLGEAARELATMFSIPIILPIPAATRSILAMLART